MKLKFGNIGKIRYLCELYKLTKIFYAIWQKIRYYRNSRDSR